MGRKKNEEPKRRLLKRHDIILLEKGMDIYVEIPKKFIFDGEYKNNELEKTKITIGEKRVLILPAARIRGLKVGPRDYRRLIRANLESLTTQLINQGVKIPENDIAKLPGVEILDTSTCAGEYHVYHAASDDKGHHVFCERDDGLEVDFYQDGYCTAIIPPEQIKPINK